MPARYRAFGGYGLPRNYVGDGNGLGGVALVEPATVDGTGPASPSSDRAAPTAAPSGTETRVVTHLDVYSVARISLAFYLIVLVVLVVASFLLWVVADAFGAVDSIQRTVKSLFDVKTYVLHPFTIALYTSAFGAVLAVAGTIANVLAATIYNLISEAVGGIRFQTGPAPDGERHPTRPRLGGGARAGGADQVHGHIRLSRDAFRNWARRR